MFPSSMTPQERKIIEEGNQAWNKYLTLSTSMPREHALLLTINEYFLDEVKELAELLTRYTVQHQTPPERVYISIWFFKGCAFDNLKLSIGGKPIAVCYIPPERIQKFSPNKLWRGAVVSALQDTLTTS